MSEQKYTVVYTDKGGMLKVHPKLPVSKEEAEASADYLRKQGFMQVQVMEASEHVNVFKFLEDILKSRKILTLCREAVKNTTPMAIRSIHDFQTYLAHEIGEQGDAIPLNPIEVLNRYRVENYVEEAEKFTQNLVDQGIDPASKMVLNMVASYAFFVTALLHASFLLTSGDMQGIGILVSNFSTALPLLPYQEPTTDAIREALMDVQAESHLEFLGRNRMPGEMAQ